MVRQSYRSRMGGAIAKGPAQRPARHRVEMHLAFVHAHNAFVDRARASGQTTSRVRDVREPFAAITAA